MASYGGWVDSRVCLDD